MCTCWAIAATGMILAASHAAAEGPAGELEGTWTVTAVTMNGIKATNPIAGKLKVTVRGNKLTLKPGLSVNGDGKVEAGNAEGDEAVFTLDTSKSPGRIDLTFGSGNNKIAVKGIYSVESGEVRSSATARRGGRRTSPTSRTPARHFLIAKRDKP